MEAPPSPLSSRPKRTRISCHAALDKTARAPFRKEGRMKCNNATKFHRKSGVAQWRDLLFIIRGIESQWKRRPPLCHPDRSVAQRRDLQFPSIHSTDTEWKHRPPRCRPDRSVGQRRDLLFIIHGIESQWKRRPPLCHPDRSVPGFPATQCWTRPRVRPSVKKGA
jgi:hypothetical protein